MIDIKLTDGREMREALKGFEKQIPFATALALTSTANDAQKAVIVEINQAFDKPTPFTLKSVFVKRATKANLVAQIVLRDEATRGTAPAKYLSAQIKGGPRRDKGAERAMRMRNLLTSSEYLIAGKDAPLNQYGNLTGGQVRKALSNIGGGVDSTQDTNSDRSRKKMRRSGRSYFFRPGVGIFFRQGQDVKSFLIIGKRPQYEPTFEFFDVINHTIEKKLPGNLQAAIERALATAKGPG